MNVQKIAVTTASGESGGHVIEPCKACTKGESHDFTPKIKIGPEIKIKFVRLKPIPFGEIAPRSFRPQGFGPPASDKWIRFPRSQRRLNEE